MLKQFMHTTMDGKLSSMWGKRTSVKILEQPRLGICMPVGSKMQWDLPLAEGGEPQEVGAGIRIPAVVPVQLLTAMQQLVMPLNSSVTYFTQYGMYAGEARQILTTNALRHVHPSGYLLYWDDDTIPDNMALYTMWNYMEQNPDVGLLSAVYSTRENPTEPLIYKTPTQGVDWSFSMGPTALPEEIFSAGAGFMLVRIEAIKAAITLIPDEPVWADMKTVRDWPGEAPHPYLHLFFHDK